MAPEIKLKSIENASVIRKFAVLFSLMSLFPFIIITALFYFFTTEGTLKISQNIFFWAFFLVGIFAFVGFVGMRKTLIGLIKVSESAKDVLSGDFSKRIDVKTEGDNEVTQLARAFNEVVKKLENNIKELEKSRLMVQEVLLRVSSGVSSTENIDSFVDLIMQVTMNAVSGVNSILLLHDEAKNDLVVKSSCGTGAIYAKGSRLSLEGEVPSLVMKQKKPLLIPRMSKVMPQEASAGAFDPPLICAPLIFQNKVIGVIAISGKKNADNFVEDELLILSNIASQIALAVENARLNADNQKAYMETITALALAVEARDVYSRGHSDRVGEYSVKIAQKLGLDEQRIRTIKEAAQLHDVGKIGISDEILRKPDTLNAFERNIMEQHVIIGEGIIIPLHGFSHLRDPIRHHHEWLDGAGYPDRLKGDQISLEARILAVADSFDAMTTDRPYRKGLDFKQAKEELQKYRSIRYDPKVIDALLECLNL